MRHLIKSQRNSINNAAGQRAEIALEFFAHWSAVNRQFAALTRPINIHGIGSGSDADILPPLLPLGHRARTYKLITHTHGDIDESLYVMLAAACLCYDRRSARWPRERGRSLLIKATLVNSRPT